MKVKSSLLWVLISILLGITVTHHFETEEIALLMPVRDAIMIGGKSKEKSDDFLVVNRYKNIEGEVINPVSVAMTVKSKADRILRDYKEHKSFDSAMYKEKDLSDIVKAADFFKEQGELFTYRGSEYKLWPYNFDYPTYGISKPWYSGMAQGFAIEVLLSAYVITEERQYLEQAKLGGNALGVPIQDNGVATYIDNGDNGIWFEEYANKFIEPPFVLNGHNFALIGLKKLMQFDEGYTSLFESGMKALEYMLPKFDAGVWSKYDLSGKLANTKYHGIHIDQIRELNAFAHNQTLVKYESKFTVYRLVPIGTVFRLVNHPNTFLIVVCVMNTVIFFLLILLLRFAVRKTKSNRLAKREVFHGSRRFS